MVHRAAFRFEHIACTWNVLSQHIRAGWNHGRPLSHQHDQVGQLLTFTINALRAYNARMRGPASSTISPDDCGDCGAREVR